MKRIIHILLTLVIALGMLAAILLRILFPTPRFPKPTGPYAIGTNIYHWTDATRPEPFTLAPHDQRELMVQIWYPSSASSAAPFAPLP